MDIILELHKYLNLNEVERSQLVNKEWQGVCKSPYLKHVRLLTELTVLRETFNHTSTRSDRHKIDPDHLFVPDIEGDKTESFNKLKICMTGWNGKTITAVLDSLDSTNPLIETLRTSIFQYYKLYWSSYLIPLFDYLHHVTWNNQHKLRYEKLLIKRNHPSYRYFGGFLIEDKHPFVEYFD